MTNPIQRICYHHKLLKTACTNCGAEFLYCPVCHPDQLICSLCIQVHFTPLKAQGKIHKVKIGEKQIILARREATRLNNNNLHKKYRREHQEELNQRQRTRYAMNKEYYQELGRARQANYRFRLRESGLPNEEDRKARRSLSKKICYMLKREQYLAKGKEYRERHAEEIKARKARYREEHREEIRARDREKYRARSKQQAV